MKSLRIILAIILLYGGAISAYCALMTYQPTGVFVQQETQISRKLLANAKTEQERDKLYSYMQRLEHVNAQVNQRTLTARVGGFTGSAIFLVGGGLLLLKTLKKKSAAVSS